ncbi:MAG: efflux RND transporter periplasmic adaptor subunit [Burkholderiales bacterium]|jgi:membrane fusion protein (multidrug efflux system)
MNKTVALLVSTIVVFLIGGGAYWLGTKNASSAPKPSGAAPAAAPKGPGGPPPVAVDAAKVKLQTLPTSITAVGSLRSDESIVLRPEVSGRIAEISFSEGKPIAKGATIVRLDQSVQRAELAQAEANLALANSRVERARDLHKKGFISSQALDEAESTYKATAAAQQLSAARLSKLELLAPFAGVVGLRQVSIGDYVREGQDIVNLEKIDLLKVDFRVPEQFHKQLAVGQSLQLNLDAFSNRTFEGQVFAINPLLDANGRAVVIRARVKNPDNRLRPGMFARVRLLTNDSKESMVIPEQAIVALADEFFVFKLADGRAIRTKVEIGQRSTGIVEVLSGLAATDSVVTGGQPKLRDGARVQIATLDGAPLAPTSTASVPAQSSPDTKSSTAKQ